MTQDFWWFALVGFLIGFVLSTLWEWLHFRSKRMRIQNRRIAELEAALRTAQAQINTAPPPAPNPWPATDFLGPAVYLETEGAVIAPGATATPPSAPLVTRDTNPVLATTAAALTAVAVTKALTNDADAYDADGKEASAMVAADTVASADSQLMASEAPAAAAVTPPAAVADQVESGHDSATTPPENTIGADGKRLAAAALAAGAVALARADDEEDVSAPEQPPDETPQAATVPIAGAAAVQAAISPQEIDHLVGQIQAALTNAEATTAANAQNQTAAAGALPAANSAAELSRVEGSYAVNNLSRSEYATVRIIQSMRHSVRRTANRVGLGRFLAPDQSQRGPDAD